METNDNILALIEGWLRGELNAEQTAAFNTRMAEDPEFAEEVNSFKEVFDTLDETTWNLRTFNPDSVRAREYLSFYSDPKNKAYLNELKEMSKDRQSGRKINMRAVLGVIGVAAMIVIGIVFIRDSGHSTDYNALYTEYATLEEIPTFTVRGRTDSLISQVELQFKARNFEEVNAIVNDHKADFEAEQISLVSLYHGVAFGERGLYEEASRVLSNKELFENSMYNQMPEWYLALILLKNEADRAEAKEILKRIAKDDEHYKQSEAIQILGKL